MRLRADALAALGLSENPAFVIEGCYSDLLELVLPECSELLFLNPGAEQSVRNCRARPWEPHEYASKAAQDANLELDDSRPSPLAVSTAAG